MRTNRFAIFTTALLFVALALSVGAGAADQHSGTWKMNPAKSKYSPGPVPKSTTVKVESDADNIKLSSDGIDAAGNPTHGHHNLVAFLNSGPDRAGVEPF